MHWLEMYHTKLVNIQGNFTDVDECDIGMENCDANAGCTNSDGSYTCSCLSGYSGDGAYCYGRISFKLK